MTATSNKHLIFRFFLATWLILGVSACSKPDQNENEGSVPAPGIPYSAIIFHRKADSLRTETENISIVRDGEVVLNDIGNVYSASREPSGKQKLWINWRGPDSLQIFRNPETKSYKEEKHFDCLTGVFVQTTPFKIEYGDIRDVKLPDSADTSRATAAKTPVAPKTTKAAKKRRLK